MIWINGTLRLANDPQARTTKTGGGMAFGFGFADIEGVEGLGLALLAFGSIAEELLRYRKGDSVRVSGTLRENRYTGRDGAERVTLQVALDGLAGVKRGQPVQSERKPRKRAKDATGAPPPAPAFDDELAF